MASTSLRLIARSSRATSSSSSSSSSSSPLTTPTVHDTLSSSHGSALIRVCLTRASLPSSPGQRSSRQQPSFAGRRLYSSQVPLSRTTPPVRSSPSSRGADANSTIRVVGGRSIWQSTATTWQARFFSSTNSRADAEKPDESKTTSLSPTSTSTSTPTSTPSSSTVHENIYTLPNLLTLTRLLSAPVIGYSILTGQPLLALAVFTYAGLTDLVDGALARRHGSTTVLGTILDPLADKTLMTTAVVCLTLSAQLPWWLAAVVLSRDGGLALSALRWRWVTLPAPRTWRRYWDFSLPSAEVRPTEISKVNTLLQLLLVGDVMVLPVLPQAWVEAWNLVGVTEGWMWLVAGTTVWSGLSYVFVDGAVRVVSEAEKKKKEEEEEEGEDRGRQ